MFYSNKRWNTFYQHNLKKNYFIELLNVLTSNNTIRYVNCFYVHFNLLFCKYMNAKKMDGYSNSTNEIFVLHLLFIVHALQ